MQKIGEMTRLDWMKSVVRALISGTFIGTYLGGATVIFRMGFDPGRIDGLTHPLLCVSVVVAVVSTMVLFLVAFVAVLFWSYSEHIREL